MLRLRSGVLLAILIALCLMPLKIEAQLGYSTDSLGNLIPDKVGVSTDAQGREFNPAGDALQNTIKGLCPLVEIFMKVGASLVVLLGFWRIVQGAKQGGGLSASGLRQGFIMIVLAGALLSLPSLLSLVGLEYLTNRADNANIWSCLWT